MEFVINGKLVQISDVFSIIALDFFLFKVTKRSSLDDANTLSTPNFIFLIVSVSITPEVEWHCGELLIGAQIRCIESSYQ